MHALICAFLLVLQEFVGFFQEFSYEFLNIFYENNTKSFPKCFFRKFFTNPSYDYFKNFPGIAPDIPGEIHSKVISKIATVILLTTSSEIPAGTPLAIPKRYFCLKRLLQNFMDFFKSFSEILLNFFFANSTEFFSEISPRVFLRIV